MDREYLLREIGELSQFPGINTALVEEEVGRAGGDPRLLVLIYDDLMAECYGDTE